jgi:hypothetical protein
MIFSGYSIPSTNKTDHHDISEILLKEALNTTTLSKQKLCRQYSLTCQKYHMKIEIMFQSSLTCQKSLGMLIPHTKVPSKFFECYLPIFWSLDKSE